MKNQSADYLLSPKAIRETTAKLYEKALSGESFFNLDESKLDPLSDFVVDIIKANYPDLNIPYHSRWGHFRAGNNDRLSRFLDILPDDKMESARIQFDLVIPSILLDAGAGKDWQYLDRVDSKTYSRSEGLGIASFYMFNDGEFSLDTENPLRADAEKLASILPTDIAKGFQVTDKNPLVGLEGRSGLVSNLGKCILKNKKVFKTGRPGDLVNFLVEPNSKKISAEKILKSILVNFGEIWPGRLKKDTVELGDVWEHKATNNELVVFHKLSQWMSYSLFEPLESAGFTIIDTDKLTGLAEYRNGGLFIDGGVIGLKDTELYNIPHLPSSDLVIEWRALTIQLLDRIAPIIREKLDLSEKNFPLAKVLEGGTWWAGRALANKFRSGGEPPIQIKSDGTVF